MRKLLVLTLLFFLFINPNVIGQDYKFLTGGSLGMSFDREKSIDSELTDTKNSNISVSGLLGYYLTKDIVIGAELTYDMDKTNYKGATHLKNIDYIFSPLLRFYFNQAFIQAQGNFGKSDHWYQTEIILGDPAFKAEFNDLHKVVGWGLGIGYDISLTNRLFLEPLVKYKSNKYIDNESEDDLKKSGLTFHVGLVFSL
ncbi:outer membrane beta-barrel protein [Carboxylicivirga sp. N1Y90]|uniref:outer membrane beta-barrel protein n=1 Tax=Carboxylicivirga fragile TaxID=3417571 RepID=UPI003D329FEC|nr:outer membrane beta-barrel protein [Marinilabiliaceae bacterium N1Y90]